MPRTHTAPVTPALANAACLAHEIATVAGDTWMADTALALRATPRADRVDIEAVTSYIGLCPRGLPPC